MFSFTQLEYLLALDQYRHFGKAAQHCHVSQPSLSMQIQKMEEMLDLVLFDRSKRPILPTAAGEEILSRARSILKEKKCIEDIAKFHTKEFYGDFHLGVIPTLAPYLIPSIICSFQKNAPNVNLKISEMKTEEIIRGLDDDSLDAALCATPLKNDAIIERVLFYETFHLYLPEKMKKLFKGQSINIDELAQFKIWSLGEGHCFKDQVNNLCSHIEEHEGVFFQAGSFETLMNLVDRSEGKQATFIPQLCKLMLPTERKQKVLDFSGEIPCREISVVYSRPFLKEKIIDEVEKSILNFLPDGVRSPKDSSEVHVIELLP